MREILSLFSLYLSEIFKIYFVPYQHCKWHRLMSLLLNNFKDATNTIVSLFLRNVKKNYYAHWFFQPELVNSFNTDINLSELVNCLYIVFYIDHTQAVCFSIWILNQWFQKSLFACLVVSDNTDFEGHLVKSLIHFYLNFAAKFI